MNATTHPQTLGRYAIHDRIASGGMATVYFGQLLGTGGFSRIVAIKRLHPHLAEGAEFAAMLLDEAYLAGRIRHPNVVSTLDVVSSDGELFIVMDYVHGETLAQLAKAAMMDGKPVPIEIVSAIMVGVLNGLHAAHETTNEQGKPLGIVHRDVSPHNIIVGLDGIPRLLDFGVAKAQDRIHTTKNGEVKGKLAYMSVEQLTNQEVDRRSDIYGAGVVLWELLAGRRLFSGETEGATMHIILGGTHPPPSSSAPGLPAALDAITMRALARDRSGRYETARQMAVALEQAAPPATATAVGEWVASLAEPKLAERARIMRAIDARRAPRADAGHPVESASPVLLASPGPASSSAITEAAPSVSSHPPSKLKRPWLYALAGAAGVALVSATLATRASPGKSPGPPTGAPPPTAVPTVAPSAAAAVATIEPLALKSSAPSTSSRPSAPSPPAATAAPRARSGTRPAAPAGPSTKPDCNPPYTVDAAGVRHYKKECPLE
jgi:serine/threonine-protein kinase